MADVKTNLRELGVVYSLLLCGVGMEFNYEIKPVELVQKCANILEVSKEKLAVNVCALETFSSSHKQILKNSYKLAESIHEKLLNGTKNMPCIKWLGNDTKFAPCDIRVNNLSISLKEDSFILENMGLYKYLSLMTGKNFKRGMHVFEYFAKDEYEKWFSYAWGKLINSRQRWELRKGKNVSVINFDNDFVSLKLNDAICTLPADGISLQEYNKATTSKFREKVFSKWIKQSCEKEEDYLAVKKKCAETAGENLCELINKNLKHENLARFLGIRSFEYYYAKSTANETTILKVPVLKNFDRFFEVESVRYSVPVSQLNIHTRIKNRATGKVIEFRNECRFSHGQLNGTPEAKMYYPRGTDLSHIFFEI